MKMKLKVKDPKVLEELWDHWVEENEAHLEAIRESGGSTINEPVVRKGTYYTASGKGKYTFEGETLTFEGFRGAFGSTKFFAITQRDDEIVLCSASPKDPMNEACVLLEKLSFETSAPEKLFEI